MMLSCTKHTRSAVYDLKKKKRKNIRGKTSQGFNYENHTIILREPLHNMPTFYTFRLPHVIFELPVHHLALFIYSTGCWRESIQIWVTHLQIRADHVKIDSDSLRLARNEIEARNESVSALHSSHARLMEFPTRSKLRVMWRRCDDDVLFVSVCVRFPSRLWCPSWRLWKWDTASIKTRITISSTLRTSRRPYTT